MRKAGPACWYRRDSPNSTSSTNSRAYSDHLSFLPNRKNARHRAVCATLAPLCRPTHARMTGHPRRSPCQTDRGIADVWEISVRRWYPLARSDAERPAVPRSSTAGVRWDGRPRHTMVRRGSCCRGRPVPVQRRCQPASAGVRCLLRQSSADFLQVDVLRTTREMCSDRRWLSRSAE